MIKIVTDSTANLPKSLVNEYNITVIPTYVHFDKQTFLDGVDLSSSEFYEKLVASPRLPTTSQASVNDFTETYKRILDAHPGASILSIHISEQLSGFLGSARQAAAFLPDVKITIFDSRAVALGVGLQVIEAAKMVKAGKSLEEILARLEIMRDGMNLYWTLETLDYLAKGGRIGKAARFMGGLLNIKPIIRLHKGAVDPYSRERSRQKAVDTIRQMALDQCKGKEGVHLAVMHTVEPQLAQQLALELSAALNPVTQITAELTPAVGVYSGPGMLGLGWCIVPPTN